MPARRGQAYASTGCTALHYAARFGRIETARWLIDHKADVNTLAYKRSTPMHLVSDGAVARLLIKSGADLKANDSWRKTPLQNAAEQGNKSVCDAILESGYPIDLASARWLGKRDAARKMIEQNPAIVKPTGEDSDLWGIPRRLASRPNRATWKLFNCS